MQYISPFDGLGIPIDGNFDKAALNLAKKRLLAELELADSTTILRGAVELTKDDIIDEFDKIGSKKIKYWYFHQLIARDKVLLNFVQNRYWDAQKRILNEPHYESKTFIKFISPYFSESYKYLIIKYLASAEPDKLKDVLNMTPLFMTKRNYKFLWFSVYSFIDNLIYKFNSIIKNEYDNPTYEKLESYQTEDFMKCLNLLPADFSELRSKYAEFLLGFSSYIWNYEDRQNAIEIIENAQLINVSFRTERLLQKRKIWFEEQIEELNDPESSTRWSKAKKFQVFCVILYFVVRTATCCYDYEVRQARRMKTAPPKIEYPKADKIFHNTSEVEKSKPQK